MKLILEDRFLFDASLVRTVKSVEQAHHDVIKATDAPKNIVFIDARISNSSTLLNGVKADAKAIRIDFDKDGIKEITSILKNYKNIDSISIVGYGQNNQIQIGDSLFTSATTKDNQDIASWSESMSRKGEIYLYGCEVGHESDVVKNIDADTHHDTFAADTKIGNGVWTVEDVQGDKGTYNPFTDAALRDFKDVLDVSSSSISASLYGSADVYNDNVSGRTTFVPGSARVIAISLTMAAGRTITNNGNDIVLTETLPSGMNYVPGSFSIFNKDSLKTDGTQPYIVQNGNVLEIHLGKTLYNPYSSTSSFVFYVSNYLGSSATEGQIFTPTFSLAHDGTVDTSFATITTHIPALSVKVQGAVAGNNYTFGSKVSYIITVSNTGLVDAFNTVLSTVVSKNLTNVVITDSNGNQYSPSNTNIGEVAAGTTQTYTLTGTIGNNLSQDLKGTIIPTISYNGSDDNNPLVKDVKTLTATDNSYTDNQITTDFYLDSVPTPTVSVTTGESSSQEVTAGHDYYDALKFTNNTTKTLFNPFSEIFMHQSGHEISTLTSATYLGQNLDIETTKLIEKDGVVGAYEPLSSSANGTSVFVKAPDGYVSGDIMYSVKIPLTSVSPGQSIRDINLNFHVDSSSDITAFSQQPLTYDVVSGYLTGEQPVFNANSEMIRGNDINNINATEDQYAVGGVTVTHNVNLVDLKMVPVVVTNEAKSPSAYPGEGYMLTLSPGGQTATTPVTNYDVTFKLPDNVSYNNQKVTESGFASDENPTVTISDGYVHVHFDKLYYTNNGESKTVFIPMMFTMSSGSTTTTIKSPEIDYKADSWTYNNNQTAINGSIQSQDSSLVTMPFSVYDTSYDGKWQPGITFPGDNITNRINIVTMNGANTKDLTLQIVKENLETIDPTQPMTYTYQTSDGVSHTLTFTFNKDSIQKQTIADQVVYTSAEGNNVKLTRDATTGKTTLTFDLSGENKSENGTDEFTPIMSGSVNFTSLVSSRYTAGDNIGKPVSEGQTGTTNSLLSGSFGTDESKDWTAFSNSDVLSKQIIQGSTSVSVYAVNGHVTQNGSNNILSGSNITYKSTYHLSTGNYDNLKLYSYLPSGVFNVTNPTNPSGASLSTSIDNAGNIWVQDQSNHGMVVGTYSLENAPDGVKITSVGVDPNSNALIFYISGNNAGQNVPSDISVVYTLKSSSIISQSNIPVIAQGQSVLNYNSDDSGSGIKDTAFAQATIDQPFIYQKTGIVSILKSDGTEDSSVTYSLDSNNTSSNASSTTNPDTAYMGDTNNPFKNGSPTSIGSLQDLDAKGLSGNDKVRIATSIEAGTNGASGDVYSLVVNGTLPTGVTTDSISNFKILRADGEVVQFVKPDGTAATLADYFSKTGVLLKNPDGSSNVLSGNGSNASYLTVFYDVNYTPAVTYLGNKETFSSTILNYSNKDNGDNYAVQTSNNVNNVVDSATITNSDPTFSRTMDASNFPEDDNVDSSYPNQTMVPGEVRTIHLNVTMPEGSLTNNGNDVVVTETLPDNIHYVANSGTVNFGGNIVSSDGMKVVQNGNVLEFHLGKTVTNNGNDPLKISYNVYLDNNGSNKDTHTFTAQLNYAGDSLAPVSQSIIEHDPTLLMNINNDNKIPSSGSPTTYTINVSNTDLTTAYNAKIALNTSNLNISNIKDQSGNSYAIDGNGIVNLGNIPQGNNIILTVSGNISNNIGVKSTVSFNSQLTWSSVPNITDGQKTYIYSLNNNRSTPPFIANVSLPEQTATNVTNVSTNTTDIHNIINYTGQVTSTNNPIGTSSMAYGVVAIPPGENKNVHILVNIPKGLDVSTGNIFGQFISQNGISSTTINDLSNASNTNSELKGQDASSYNSYSDGNIIGLLKENNNITKNVTTTNNSDGSTQLDINLGDITNNNLGQTNSVFVLGYMSRVLNTPENITGRALTTSFRLLTNGVDGTDGTYTPMITQTVVEPYIQIQKSISSIDQSTGIVTYKDTITNTSNFSAYNVVLKDGLDNNYQKDSFSYDSSALFNNSNLASAGESTGSNGLSFTIALKELDNNQSYTFTYSAKLLTPTQTSTATTANVTWSDISQNVLDYMNKASSTEKSNSDSTSVYAAFNYHSLWGNGSDDGTSGTSYSYRDGSNLLTQDDYISSSKAGVTILNGRFFDTLGDDTTDYTEFSKPLVGLNLSTTTTDSNGNSLTSSTTTATDGTWSMIVANGTGTLNVSGLPSGETYIYNSMTPDYSNPNIDNHLNLTGGAVRADHIYEKSNTAPTLSVTATGNSTKPFSNASFDDKEIDILNGASQIHDGFVVQRYNNAIAAPNAIDTFSIDTTNTPYSVDSKNIVYNNGEKVGSFTMQNGVFTFTASGVNDPTENKTLINNLINAISYTATDMNGSVFISRSIGVNVFDGNTTSITSLNGGTGPQGIGGNQNSQTIFTNIYKSEDTSYIHTTQSQSNFVFVEPNNSDPATKTSHILNNINISYDNGVSGATITLAGQPEDQLIINPSAITGGIGYSFSADGKTITLAGNAQNTDYQSALRAIGFIDTSATPDTKAERYVTLTITDSTGHVATSNTGDISVQASNDSPIIGSKNGSSVDGLETHTGIDATPAATDGTPLTKLIGSYTDSDGNNAHDGSAITPDGVAISSVDSTHGSYWFTQDGGKTWTEFASKTNPYDPTKHALRLEINDNTKIAFVPTDINYNGLIEKAVNYRIWDHFDGKSDGLGDPLPTDALGQGINTDGSSYSATTATTSIMVDNLNNAPIAANGDIQTNDAENNIAAHTISDLVKNHFDDSADNQYDSNSNPQGSVANNLAGIAIVNSNQSSQGSWQYQDNNGNWQTIPTTSDTSALILSANTQIKFVPTSLNYNGTTPALTIRVIDDSNINNVNPYVLNGQMKNVLDNGGSSSISANTINITDVINSFHVGPSVVNGTSVTTEENEHGVLVNPTEGKNTVAGIFGGHFDDSADNQYDPTNNPNGTKAATLQGVFITQNNVAAEGNYEYKDSQGNWQIISQTLTQTKALYLDANTEIKFVPTQTNSTIVTDDIAGFNGLTRTMNVQLVDSTATGLTSGSIVDSTAATYNTSITKDVIGFNTKIDAVNNAPVITGQIIETTTQGAAPTIYQVTTFQSNYDDSLDNQKTDWNPTGSVANNFAGIVITNNPSDSSGKWQYGTTNQYGALTWNDIGNVSDTYALVLDKDAAIRYLPNSQYFNGATPKLTYHNFDDSGATITSQGSGTAYYTNITGNGIKSPTSSMSENTSDFVINVQHIHIAPNVSNNVVSFNTPDDEGTDGQVQTVNSLLSPVFDGSANDQQSSTNTTGSQATHLGGIAVIGNTTLSSEGNWQYQDSSGKWQDIGTVSDKNALILSADTYIRFQPLANYNGTPKSLDVRLIDNSNATIPVSNGQITSGVDVTNNGGNTSISSQTVAIEQHVTSENNSPVGIKEGQMPDDKEDNTSPTTVAQAFANSFDDSADNQRTSDNPDGSIANNFAGIAITKNPTPASEGSWQYQDTQRNWQNFGTLSPTNALILSVNTNIRFVPVENFNGASEPLEVHVVDDSGSKLTINEPASYQDISNIIGNRSSISANTIPLKQIIDPVNNAPVATSDHTIFTANEGQPTTKFISDVFKPYFDDSADNQVSDINPTGSVANNFAGVVITDKTTSSYGRWQYQNFTGDWTDIGNVSSTNGFYLAKDTKIRFNPTDSKYNGTTPTMTAHLVEDSTQPPNTATFRQLIPSSFGGTTAISAGTVTMDEVIVPVHQGPNATSTNVQSEIDEHGNKPMTVQDVFSPYYTDQRDDMYNETDNANGTKPAPFAGIAVTGNTTKEEGTWQWQDAQGNWNNIGGVTEGQALTLSADTKIRFQPTQETYPNEDATQSAGFNGVTRPLTVKLIDGTFGTVTSGHKISVSDYPTSTTPENISYTAKVDAINNAPYATDNTTAQESENRVPTVINVNDKFQPTFDDSNDQQYDAVNNPTGSKANIFAGVAITGNPITSKGTWQYQDNSGNWQNIGPVSDTHALILNPDSHLRFVPATNFNGMAPDLTYHLIDNSGSTITTTPAAFYTDVSNYGGSSSVSYNSAVLQEKVVHIKSAPIASNNDVWFDQKGDEDKTDGPSESVNALVKNSFDDSVDNQYDAVNNPTGSKASNLAGVAVTANNTPDKEGSWQYQDSNGNWNNIGTVSDTHALILDKDTNLRFVPSAHFNGEPKPLTTRLIDDSDNTVSQNANTYMNVSTNGGSSAVSGDIVHIHQIVTSENNAPIASGDGHMPDVYEDHTQPVTTQQAFGSTFSDPLDNQQTSDNPTGSVSDNFAGIAVTANNTPDKEGSWQYQDNQGNWNNIGAVSENNALILGRYTQIRFNPNENFNGQPESLTAHVIDSSGSQIAVKDFDAYRADISQAMGGRSSVSEQSVETVETIIPVNNAPIVKDYTLPVNIEVKENGSVITTAGTLFGKYFDDSADNQKSDINPTGSVSTNFAGIAITNIPSDEKGVWSYKDSQGNWNDITNVSPTNALIVGKDTELKFTPTSNYNGATSGFTGRLISDYNNQVTPTSATYGDATYSPTGIYSAGSVASTVTIDPIIQPPTIDSDMAHGAGNKKDPVVVTAQSLLSGYSDDKNNVRSANNPTGTIGYPDGGIIVTGVGSDNKGVWTYTIGNQVYQLPNNLSPEHALILPKDTVFTYSPDRQSKGVSTLNIAGYAANPNAVLANGLTGAQISEMGIVQNADITHSVLVSNIRSFSAKISKYGSRPILTNVTVNDATINTVSYHNPHSYVLTDRGLDIGSHEVGKTTFGTFASDSINDVTINGIEGDDNTAYQADGSALPSWLSYDNKTHSFTGTPSDNDSDVNLIVKSGSGTDAHYYQVHINVEKSPTELAALWSELGLDHKDVQKVSKTKAKSKGKTATKKGISFHDKLNMMM